MTLIYMKILVNVLLIIVVIVVGLLILSRYSLPGLNFDVLVVETGSMEPAIKTGSIVFVSPVDLYTEEDIITFQRSASKLGAPITHRIVGVEVVSGEYVYTTKGDANDFSDTARVLQKEVLGKVRFHMPYIGWVLGAAKTQLGFIILVIIPALLVVFDEVRRILREIKKGDDAVPTANQE
jgi:signal peptidase I